MLGANDVSLNERLRLAASNGHTAKVLELLEEGATYDVDREGRTVLHLASQFGHADTVAALLLNGCDVNTPDFAGHTPLHRASAEGHPEIVQQLLKHGARIDSQDDAHGNTALHESAWKGYSQTLEVLCKAKANVYIKNKGGFAPLHLACQNGHNQSCRVLLLTGCRPDIKNNYGDTPMHTAARYGHAGVMRILISAGCKVSEQNKNGDTALHISVAMGRRKLTRILLESNCDQYVKNKQGETSLHIARRKEFKEVQELLLHPPSQRIPVQQSTEKKSHKKREKGSGTSSKDSGSRHKEKHKKTKRGVHFPDKAKDVPDKWSPYGCHFYPNLASFPAPKLDSLPKDPLKKGEQYYLDLSGNICKGPVGVNYACYCAPFFQHVEKKLDRDKADLINHIKMSSADLQTRMANLERRTRGRLLHLSQAMQEKLANEQVDCRERSERRALQERMALEHQQEQCTDFVRTELKSWVQSKMDDFERKHYCQLHNPRDFARQSLPMHQCFRGGRRQQQQRRRTMARSRSEELLSDHYGGDDALSNSSANLGACAAPPPLQPLDAQIPSASQLGAKSKRPLPYLTNGDNGEDENDYLLNELHGVLSPNRYLETDFDGSFTSPDSGCNTQLPAVDCGAGYDPNDGLYPGPVAVTEPEFKMTRQFYDTVSNEMEKWYERRLENIEKKAELKVSESQDTIEGRILAIEEQLTKINESFSVSGGSRSASSLV